MGLIAHFGCISIIWVSIVKQTKTLGFACKYLRAKQNAERLHGSIPLWWDYRDEQSGSMFAGSNTKHDQKN